MWPYSLIIQSWESRVDPDDKFHSGYQNISHHYEQKSFSGLPSPRWSHHTITCYPRFKTFTVEISLFPFIRKTLLMSWTQYSTTSHGVNVVGFTLETTQIYQYNHWKVSIHSHPSLPMFYLSNHFITCFLIMDRVVWFRSVTVDGGITSIALRGQGHQVCSKPRIIEKFLSQLLCTVKMAKL